MIRVWSQFIGTFVLVFLAGGAITGAFFSDIEIARESSLGAFKLDAELVGSGLDLNVCSAGGGGASPFTVENTGGLEFEYSILAIITQNDGGICDLVELSVYRNSEIVYEGSIVGLNAGVYALESGAQDVWNIAAAFPEETAPVSGVCGFDMKVLANQLTFMSGEAFYDIEISTHSIAVDAGLCVPPEDTVNLRMDKHISGVTNGFSVDQFSYHIVGDGIDVVVPHGGIIALPIGAYTIEELVPEGFLKEDWRIGWYGECESGSEFTTTIEIDDGNIDHGVLDCQADNQYRPDHGDNESETDEESSSEQLSFESFVIEVEPERSTRERSSRDERERESSVVADSDATTETPEEIPIEEEETLSETSEEVENTENQIEAVPQTEEADIPVDEIVVEEEPAV